METKSQSAQKTTDNLTPHQRKVKLIAERTNKKEEGKRENTPVREISTSSFRLGETPRPHSAHTKGETAATRTITPIPSRLVASHTVLNSPPLIKAPEHKTTLTQTATLGGTNLLTSSRVSRRANRHPINTTRNSPIIKQRRRRRDNGGTAVITYEFQWHSKGRRDGMDDQGTTLAELQKIKQPGSNRSNTYSIGR